MSTSRPHWLHWSFRPHRWMCELLLLPFLCSLCCHLSPLLSNQVLLPKSIKLSTMLSPFSYVLIVASASTISYWIISESISVTPKDLTINLSLDQVGFMFALDFLTMSNFWPHIGARLWPHCYGLTPHLCFTYYLYTPSRYVGVL